MSRVLFLIVAIFAASDLFAQAEQGESYLTTQNPIFSIEDNIRQAEAWAMCSAVYQIFSAINEADSPATAQLYSEMANGAEVAVLMTFVMSSILDEDEPEAFSATVRFGQTSMSALPEQQMTWLLALSEQDDAWSQNMSATYDYCVANLEAQQAYVDMSRELQQSGLFN